MQQDAKSLPSPASDSGAKTPGATRYKLARQLKPYLLVLPAMAILATFFVGPALYNIQLSFQRITLFELAEGGEWVGFENFRKLARDPLTPLAFKNTVVSLTAVTVVARIILGLILALLLNATVFRRWRIAWLARSLLLLPWITPPVVAVAAWKWLLDTRYGVVNQILLEAGLIDQGIPFFAQTSTVWRAIEVILIWRELPFVVIALLAGLQSIPRDLTDAARVDGSSELRVFFSVTLPLLRPVLAVVTLLMTIWTFNNFVYVWLSTAGGPGDYTHVLGTQVFTNAFVDYDFGLGAAVGVLMGAIMLVFGVVYFLVVLREKEA